MNRTSDQGLGAGGAADPEGPVESALGLEPELVPEEIRDRAVGGAALLGARGALIMLVGVGVNIVLARSLGPSAFGIIGLGTTLLVFGQFLSAGLGTALLRQSDPPTMRELESVLGFQLLGACGFAAISAAIAATFGHDGAVVAVMMCVVPLIMFRVPAYVMLERRLSYGMIAFVDVLDAVVFYTWALVGVWVGFGIWAVATGLIARALIGSVFIMVRGPLGAVRPRLGWADIRGLFKFGVQYQAAAVGAFARDQGLNVGVAAVGSIATLGVWNLTYRVLQVPTLAMGTLTRVSFPAMSRLLELGNDPRPTIERTVAVVATGSAILLVGMVAAAPAALPAVLGSDWDSVPGVLALSSIGMMISIPTSTAATGYLLAAGDAGTVLRNSVCEALVLCAIALPLLPVIGVQSVGFGWIGVAMVDLAILGRATSRRTGAAIVAPLALPFLIGLTGGGLGWIISSSGSQTVLNGLLGAAAGELIALIGLSVFRRDLLKQTVGIVSLGLRHLAPNRA